LSAGSINGPLVPDIILGKKQSLIYHADYRRKKKAKQYIAGRSQWPRALRLGSATARLLWLRVRIPLWHGCLLWVLCFVR